MMHQHRTALYKLFALTSLLPIYPPSFLTFLSLSSNDCSISRSHVPGVYPTSYLPADLSLVINFATTFIPCVIIKTPLPSTMQIATLPHTQNYKRKLNRTLTPHIIC